MGAEIPSHPLAAFLRARYTEQRDAALAAQEQHSGTWYVEDGRIYDGDAVVVYDEGAPTLAQATHIAMFDPATVLDDLVAKLTLVHAFDAMACDARRFTDPRVAQSYHVQLSIMATLANPFRRHPDYEPW